MKKEIFFEFYGKNFKTTIDCINNEDAENQIRNRVNILKIVNVDETKKDWNKTDKFKQSIENDPVFKDIFGTIFKK